MIGLVLQAAILGESVVDASKFGWEMGSESKPQHNWEKMVEGIQSYIKGLNWGYKTALRSAQVLSYYTIIYLYFYVDNFSKMYCLR